MIPRATGGQRHRMDTKTRKEFYFEMCVLLFVCLA